MRVVIINQHPRDALGGSEIQCDLIARRLIERGHQVVYIAVNGGDRHGTLPYKVVPVPPQGKAIVKEALAAEPTVVYWRFNTKCFRYVVKRIRDAEVPFVFAVAHIGDLRFFPTWDRLKCCQGIYGACRTTLRAMWNHGGLTRVSGLTSVNPDFIGKIETERQLFIPNGMSDAREPFSWPRPYVVWVANIKAVKRPEVCVKLARMLRERGVDVLMIGKITDDRYRWVQDPSRLPSNLFYLGAKTVEQVNGILANSLALVHTCVPEGFCNNFIQAWLQGKPTISFDFDPGGLIAKQGFGFVSNRDETRFHRDVLGIIQDPVGAERMGSKAQRWAYEHCRPEKSVDKLIGFLQEVIEADNAENVRTTGGPDSMQSSGDTIRH